MKKVFPLLSENFKYGVCINNDVQKQSWGFTLRSLTNIIDKDSKRPSKAPKQMEFIKHPDYEIVLGLIDKPDEKAEELFKQFVKAIKSLKACYTPVLGLHNCPAELEFLNEGQLEYKNKGSFKTKGFVSSKHEPEISDLVDIRLGFDKIPTYQNDDFWNLPEKYIQVVYPSGGKSITVSGEHYKYEHDNEIQWYLV